jgi:hypothetical protein
VRSAVAQLTTAHSSDVLSSPETPVNPLHGNQEGGFRLTTMLIKQRTELGHSFVLMWLDSLPRSSLLHAVASPLPLSPINDIDPSIHTVRYIAHSTLQAFTRPFSDSTSINECPVPGDLSECGSYNCRGCGLDEEQHFLSGLWLCWYLPFTLIRRRDVKGGSMRD